MRAQFKNTERILINSFTNEEKSIAQAFMSKLEKRVVGISATYNEYGDFSGFNIQIEAPEEETETGDSQF